MSTTTGIEAQNLPVGINKIDSKNKRQGDWVIWFDEEFKPINNQKAVHYYRVIAYKDDKPTGPFTDFYRNGSVQSSGKLLNDRPEDVYDGLIIWYRENGTKEQETLYKRGEIIGDTKLFSSNGSLIEEPFEIINARGLDARNNGIPDKAKHYFEDALLVASVEYGVDNINYAIVLNNLAMVQQELNEFELAEKNYLEALTIYEREVERQSELYANFLSNLGVFYQAAGKFKKAEGYLIESMNILEKIIGSAHPDYAIAVNNLGNLYIDLGLYNNAIAYLEKAVELKEISLGKESSEYATSASNLGLAFQSVGDYVRAEPLLIKALEIKKKVHGSNHSEYASCLNNMGSFYSNSGNQLKAERFFLEAKNIFEITKPNLGYSSTVNNLAIVYKQKGDYLKAEASYEECIKSKAELLGREHPSYINSLNNLAELYRETRQFEKAEPLYMWVKNSWENTLGSDHPMYATALFNLGGLYMDTHDFSKAEPLLLKAKSIREKILGKNHPDYTSCLNSLAVLYDNENMDLKAESFYTESISKKINEIQNYLPSLSEEEKTKYVKENQLFFQNFEEFCLKRLSENPALGGDLYNLKLHTKALLFNVATRIRSSILSANDPALAEMFAAWQSKRDFLAMVYRMSIEEREKNDIDQHTLEEEVNSIEKELSRQSEFFNTNNRASYSWKDVRNQLGPGEAAIEFIHTKRRKKEVITAYVALLLKPGTTNYPEAVVLENGYDLETKHFRYYRNAITQKIADLNSYDQFWKPIAQKLEGVTRVYVSSDGVYNQINLNTLIDNRKNQYLINELDIRYLTSTKDLIVAPRSTTNVISDATFFGYPNYNSTASEGDIGETSTNDRRLKFIPNGNDQVQRFFNGEDISELPGTKREIELIASFLSQKKIKVNVNVLTDASEDKLKKTIMPGVLHIATHGYFLQDIDLSYSANRGSTGFINEIVTGNPLLRSGLLLAGAKNALTPTKSSFMRNDGLLTAYEAMNLNLHKTQLVVLSACETGLGVIVNGEGVYGLQRAFAVAGARNTIMSLWKVDDVATQEFMIAFYSSWVDQSDIHTAFRKAQLEVRNKFPEPYYWGAFILTGL